MKKKDFYNLDSLNQLLTFYHLLAWYGERKTLLNLKFEGEFEGFTGRASEGWEHRFILTSDEIKIENGKIIPRIKIIGKTVDEVCSKAIKLLNL